MVSAGGRTHGDGGLFPFGGLLIGISCSPKIASVRLSSVVPLPASVASGRMMPMPMNAPAIDVFEGSLECEHGSGGQREGRAERLAFERGLSEVSLGSLEFLAGPARGPF